MTLIRIAALDLAGGLLAPYESPGTTQGFYRHTDLIAAKNSAALLICVHQS